MTQQLDQGPRWLFILLFSQVPPERANVWDVPQGLRSPQLDGYYLGYYHRFLLL